nr:glycosyltransferase family 4 protein [uncultured Rhodopila sp.]
MSSIKKIAPPVFDAPVTPLNVLHVFRYFRPDFTGEGLYLEKLARHLAAFAVRSDVVVGCTRAPQVVHTTDGVRRVRFFGQGVYRPLRIQLRMMLWFAINARSYDVVHFHAFVDRLLLLHLIARLSGCRTVHSCTLDDGLASVVLGYRPLYRPFLRRMCKLIDAVVAINPKLHAENLEVLPAARSWLIPQGVDLSPVKGERDRGRWGFRRDDIVLLFVGGMCARKDVMFLIENHAAIRAGNLPVKLLLVGPHLEHDYVESLRLAIAGSPCAADIVMQDYMDDPSPAYAAADMFVFASGKEGFGNVLIEAMALTLPIVSRRLPGVTDLIIDDGDTGLLFETATGYQNAVRTLIADPERRLAMGRAAAEAARERFDLSKIARRYSDLYRDLAAGRA